MTQPSQQEEPKSKVPLSRFLQFIGQQWQHEKRALALGIAGVTIAVSIDVLLPSLSRDLAAAIAAHNKADALWSLAKFMGCSVGFLVFWQGGYRPYCAATIRLMRRITHEAFNRIQHAGTDWHANSFSGATVRKITRGMNAFDTASDTLLTGLYPVVILVVGSVAMMWHNWPLMGLAATISFTLYTAVIIAMARRYIAPSNAAAVAQDSHFSATLADAVSCNATVKAFGSEARELQQLGETTAQWGKISLKSWMRRQDLYAVMTGLSLINQLALLGTPLYLWTKGQAGPEVVAYALTVFYLVVGQIRQVGNHVEQLQRALNDMEDVVCLEDMAPQVEDRGEAIEAKITHGEIRFEQVGFTYPSQSTPVYQNLSLTVRAGEKIGLVGASGSGKSTFVKLLQRLYDVTEGRILVDGVDSRTLTQSSLRRHIALVPQEPILFHRSLMDNIRYARPEASLEAVIAAARQAHAHTFISKLPDGYATLVGERGVKLSGGERQRVAIARAILADAPILVLDEATSSLDSVSEALIQDALDSLMQDRTTLIVAHRLSTLRAVDRILVFDNGEIVESGTHDALMAIPNGRYKQLYETQQLKDTVVEPEMA